MEALAWSGAVGGVVARCVHSELSCAGRRRPRTLIALLDGHQRVSLQFAAGRAGRERSRQCCWSSAASGPASWSRSVALRPGPASLLLPRRVRGRRAATCADQLDAATWTPVVGAADLTAATASSIDSVAGGGPGGRHGVRHRGCMVGLLVVLHRAYRHDDHGPGRARARAPGGDPVRAGRPGRSAGSRPGRRRPAAPASCHGPDPSLAEIAALGRHTTSPWCVCRSARSPSCSATTPTSAAPCAGRWCWAPGCRRRASRRSARLPRTDRADGYGPAGDVGLIISHHLGPAHRGRRSAPVGAPLAGKRVYVFAEDLRPIPPGVVRELYIAGGGLADGHVIHPVSTA